MNAMGERPAAFLFFVRAAGSGVRKQKTHRADVPLDYAHKCTLVTDDQLKECRGGTFILTCLACIPTVNMQEEC